MREIGSDFWGEEYIGAEKFRHVVFDGRSRGFLCGRTALDYIIRDAKKTIGFESILLPSYCCHTMIEPFVRNGINIRFYSVIADRSRGILCNFPSPRKEEALYLLPYFGFEGIESFGRQAKQWKFCILDETHSCFSSYPAVYSDMNIRYTYVSYRKWTDVRGLAIANKVGEDFFAPYVEKYHENYLQTKSQACSLKREYIERGTGDKQYYLDLYRKSEEMLDTDYVGYVSYQESIELYERLDIDKVREKRRDNGMFLLEELSKIEGLSLLYSSMSEACPLFFPILVENGLRDRLRKHLVDNAIYCPIHWPQSQYLVLKSQQEKELYEKELSVVCDQRYELSDMQRIVRCIWEFFV